MLSNTTNKRRTRFYTPGRTAQHRNTQLIQPQKPKTTAHLSRGAIKRKLAFAPMWDNPHLNYNKRLRLMLRLFASEETRLLVLAGSGHLESAGS